MPEDYGSLILTYLGIEPWRIPIVMMSALGIYLAFLLFVRIFGARVLNSWNGFDAVVIVMFGAVAGRVIIGHPPTLASGVIGLGTLIALEAIFGTAQSIAGWRRFSPHARVIVAHGKFVDHNLRRTHLKRTEIFTALRKAGITSITQVQCMVLESSGGLSIIREGSPIDEELLAGVIGAELVLGNTV
ncbi:DUF421 domain-containing protein [Rothia terrae]|uniref:DUF421 domain-containing protein n=1 Tax=Rothia terrae TaxID=396015 RepID=UPI0033FC2847